MLYVVFQWMRERVAGRKPSPKPGEARAAE